MEFGIDYAIEDPDFTLIKALYSASTFFRAKRYIRFCDMYLRGEFPADFGELTDEPSEHAVYGILIGPNIPSVLPSAFYDLARYDPIHQDESLRLLDSDNLCRFIRVQRGLILVWDEIQHVLLTHQCSLADSPHDLEVLVGCATKEACLARFADYKSSFLYDPIFGILNMVAEEDLESLGICGRDRKKVRWELKDLVAVVWERLAEWVGYERPPESELSTSSGSAGSSKGMTAIQMEEEREVREIAKELTAPEEATPRRIDAPVESATPPEPEYESEGDSLGEEDYRHTDNHYDEHDGQYQPNGHGYEDSNYEYDDDGGKTPLRLTGRDDDLAEEVAREEESEAQDECEIFPLIIHTPTRSPDRLRSFPLKSDLNSNINFDQSVLSELGISITASGNVDRHGREALALDGEGGGGGPGRDGREPHDEW